MSNIKFFLHDDEKITGITTKRAHYSFYEYLLDSNGNIIKTFVDGKEYRAMFVDIPHKKKPSLEDEFEIHAATATPTEYPFTEYGKTVTLNPKDDVKPAGFKSKPEWTADGNKLPDPDDVAKQIKYLPPSLFDEHINRLSTRDMNPYRNQDYMNQSYKDKEQLAKDLVDRAYRDDPEFSKRVDAYRLNRLNRLNRLDREFLWLSILSLGTAALLSVILIIAAIARQF